VGYSANLLHVSVWATLCMRVKYLGLRVLPEAYRWILSLTFKPTFCVINFQFKSIFMLVVYNNYGRLHVWLTSASETNRFCRR